MIGNRLERKKVIVKELPSGDNLSIDVFTIDSLKEGPTVYMQSAVHGAEHQGSAVIYHFLKNFTHLNFCGKLILIPNANPYALNNKSGQYTAGRFDPTTGENWNRLYQNFSDMGANKLKELVPNFIAHNKKIIMQKNIQLIKKNFKELLKLSYQKLLEDTAYSQLNIQRKLHLILQNEAIEADIVLDLHTGPNACRYLYSPEILKDEFKYFEFPHNIIIPEKFWGAMDEVAFIPWYHLIIALEKDFDICKESLFSSYTIELGSEESVNLKKAEEDSSRILNYLNHKGFSAKNPWSHKGQVSYSCTLGNFKTYFAKKAGLYDYLKKPGDKCLKGEELATALNFKSESISDIKFSVSAIEDCIIINHFTSSSVPQGAELYQVMENYKII